jgi:ELWxxDGT repeat protein
LFALGSTLYFKGVENNAYSYELWKSDGTQDGTVMVKDINPGNVASDPELFTNVNGTLYFIATESSTGRQLWKSNGTEGGTVLAANVSPGTSDSTPANFTNAGGTVFFSASDGSGTSQHGNELWQTNGTLAGTSMVQDLKAGASNGNPTEITVGNGAIFFVIFDSELWTRVGANAAEFIKAGINPDQLTFVGGLNGGNGLLFFEGYDTTNINELWKSDGTIAGTVMVKNINPTGSSGISSLTAFNGLLYFIATDGTNGNQLWRSDGISENTLPVRSDIKDVKELTRVNDRLFFVGDLYNGATRQYNDALWVMDGNGNIIQLTNIDTVLPASLAAVGSTLFFRANATGTGTELWKSDGTTTGTGIVKDVLAGNSGSNPYNLTNVNGTLFFTVWNTWDTPDRIEIWKSDGSGSGTVLVKGLEALYSNDISQLTSVHGLLAFVFNDRVHGAELWTSDGTDAGTKMVKDIYPDPSGFGSSPESLTMAVASANVQNEALFFSAIDELDGRELFILDFTPPIAAFNPIMVTPFPQNVPITIYGTASDSMPGTGVTLVQVSTDNGSTWHDATNTSAGIPWATWQYIWPGTSEGTYTIRSRATDMATNVQNPEATLTVRISAPHTMNIDLAGTGGGTVTVKVNALASYVVNTAHTFTAYTYDDILMVPNRNTYSTISWGGVCTGSGNCTYSIPTVAAGGSSHTAIATFNIDWPNAVKVTPANTTHQKISDAYKATSTISGSNIRAWGIEFADTLNFNLDKTVTLMGGDNEAHDNNNSGMTTVPGPMTIEGGSVTVDRITIR